MVHPTDPWPPASEYYPVNADGIRSDVQLIVHETPADVSLTWIHETLGQASKVSRVFIAKVRSALSFECFDVLSRCC
jgi:hypothetical protein